MAGTRNWREIRGDRPLNERRVSAFRQLMAAQQLIAEALTPYGVTDAQLDAALGAAEAALPTEECDERDFYRPALELYVQALGGRLGSAGDKAVFPHVTVDLGEDPPVE